MISGIKQGPEKYFSMNSNLIYENSGISYKYSKNKSVNRLVMGRGWRREKEEAEFLHHFSPKINSTLVYYL